MSVNFRGYVFNDAGAAVEGATVKLLETGTTTVEDTFSGGTDSNGLWYFTEADQDRYDVEITSGSSVRRIRWDDQISLKELDVRNNTGATTPAATFTNLNNATANVVAKFGSANTTRADNDEIYFTFELANSAAELTEFARITVVATDVTNGSEDGQIEFDVMKAGTLTNVWTLTSSSSAAMSFDMNVDSMTFGAGADTDITLTFDGNSADGVITWMEDEDYFKFSDDILMNSTERINFYDTAIYIYSSTDGQLDLVADTEIQIAATTIDINGAVALNGAITGATDITLSGELDAATLDISGNADIDGTTNLDAVDIDGAVQIDGTVTVGVDDTGLDVKFFGATAGSFLLWDESDDALELTDSSPIKIGDGGDMTIYHDGSNSYITNATGALKLATETSGIAVTIGHSTSEVTIADNLTVSGNLTVTGTQTIVDTVTMNAANAVVFEGATADGNETTLTIIDPTSDQTVRMPNQSGYLPVLAAASTTQISATPEELNVLDAVTAGTVTASLGVVVDSNKDIGSFRNITLTGELQTAGIGYTDGDNAITIADGGGITAAAGITSTAAANSFGATAFSGAITFDAATRDIGTTSVGLNDLHIDSGGVINFDAGDVTLTHSSNTLAIAGGNVTFDSSTGHADNASVLLGGSSDAALLWSTGDASNHALVLAVGDTSQALHITDLGAKGTDWNVSADTNPSIYLHSNSSPASTYMKLDVDGISNASGDMTLAPAANAIINPGGAGGTITFNDTSTDHYFFKIGGTFTSGGGSTICSGITYDAVMTTHSGDSVSATHMHMGSDLGAKINLLGNCATVATMFLTEPNIDLDPLSSGSDFSVTTAATLYINNAPHEGSNNYALLVDAGASRFDGAISLGTDHGDDGQQLTSGGDDAACDWTAASSIREDKDIIGLADPDEALQAILSSKAYNFHYKKKRGTGDTLTNYVGIMADEAPWAMHYKGKIVNPVNTLGYTVLAFQAMERQVEELQTRLAAIGG